MNFIGKVTKLLNKFKPEYKFLNVEELPENLKDRVIYIIGRQEQPWLLAFMCPCGCKDSIQLNLLKEAQPCWSFKIRNNKLNVFPSIRRIKSCKSHFFIRNGKIDWVKKYH